MTVYLVIHWWSYESFTVLGTFARRTAADTAVRAHGEPNNCEVYELEVQS